MNSPHLQLYDIFQDAMVALEKRSGTSQCLFMNPVFVDGTSLLLFVWIKKGMI